MQTSLHEIQNGNIKAFRFLLAQAKNSPSFVESEKVWNL